MKPCDCELRCDLHRDAESWRDTAQYLADGLVILADEKAALKAQVRELTKKLRQRDVRPAGLYQSALPGMSMPGML